MHLIFFNKYILYQSVQCTYRRTRPNLHIREICARARTYAHDITARGEVNRLSRGAIRSIASLANRSIFIQGFGESINRILLSKSLSLKILFLKNSFLEKCPSLKISFSQNPFLAKCPSRKISSFLKSLSQKFLLVREGFSLLYVWWVGGGGTGRGGGFGCVLTCNR